MEIKFQILEQTSAKIGFNINVNKTKVMRINSSNDCLFFIRGEKTEEVNKFCYRGSMLNICGGKVDDV